MKRTWTYLWQYGTIALLCFSMITMTACTVDEVLSSIDAALQTAAGLEAAIGAVSPADELALQTLISLGEAGVNAIKAAYDTYEKNKTASTLQNVVAAAQAIQTNLPQELAAAHISSPNAVQKATAWVTLMTDCAAGIVTMVGGIPASASRRVAYALTPEYIQGRWQADVCQGDAACGSLVKPHHKGRPHKFLIF